MKRRNLLVAGTAALAAPYIIRPSYAQTAGAQDPNRLGGDELTPMGSERVASASGLVPAWTGGVSTPPAGWQPGMYPPDLFGSEQPIFSVTKDNQDKYADLLCPGQQAMLNRFGPNGYRMDVYPSHRTAAMPQYVYDNIKLNVTRARPAQGGLAYGIEGAICGAPFPLPSSDPNVAGAQIMWNHLTRWQGENAFYNHTVCIVGNGSRTITAINGFSMRAPYYDPKLTPEDYANQNIYLQEYSESLGPPNQVGGKICAQFSSNLAVAPDTAYEYLQGLGRVRQLPGAEYDIPASQTDDAVNYDEEWCWGGALNRYTWKLLGKKEMIVFYNQHKILMSQPDEVMGLEFVNPDVTRHEVHRVWVIEATLAPGARMTEPRRRFYVDEDTWTVVATEAYDDQNNLWKLGQSINHCCPDLPGTWESGYLYTNFQSANYVLSNPFYIAPRPMGGAAPSYAPIPDSLFAPQNMANSGGL